jgi:hypothetical protein
MVLLSISQSISMEKLLNKGASFRCPCTVQEGDLELLCKRHATSKLQTYEDLTGIGTLGFRGEALASISCMAHLNVITRHAGSPAGLKASYRCFVNFMQCVTIQLPFWKIASAHWPLFCLTALPRTERPKLARFPSQLSCAGTRSCSRQGL